MNYMKYINNIFNLKIKIKNTARSLNKEILCFQKYATSEFLSRQESFIQLTNSNLS